MRTLIVLFLGLLVGCGPGQGESRAEATDSERVAGGADEPMASPESGGGGGAPGDAGGAAGLAGKAQADLSGAAGHGGAMAPPSGPGGSAGRSDAGAGRSASSAGQPMVEATGETTVPTAGGDAGGGPGGSPAAADGGAEPATAGGAQDPCAAVVCQGGQRCEAGICVCPSSAEAFCLAGSEWMCVNILASEEHCGACGNPCAAGQTCWAGACTGGDAQDPCIDVVCTGGQRCDAGVCVCPSSTEDLCLVGPAWECVNLLVEKQHCGSCDNQCDTDETCWAGACTGGSGGQGGAGGAGGSPSECVCDSGPCCDGCNYRPGYPYPACLLGSETPVPEYPDTAYGPYQSWCETSVGMRVEEFRNVYCSGFSTECDGELGPVVMTQYRSCWCVGDTAPGTDIPSHAECDD